MMSENKAKRKLGRPRLPFSPWRFIRCQLVDRALSVPKAKQPIRKPRLFGLIAGMTRNEVHEGLHIATGELYEHLKLIDDQDRPYIGASLRDFYYRRWNPSPKFRITVAQRVEDNIDPKNPRRFSTAAERVESEGIYPEKKDPVYLPLSNILAHYLQAQ